MTKIAFADARERALPGALLLLIVLALIALTPRPSGAAKGQLTPRPDWKSVTLIYNSDVGGKIEPCG